MRELSIRRSVNSLLAGCLFFPVLAGNALGQTYNRYAHAVAVLPDGDMLVVGGAQGHDVILATVTLQSGDREAFTSMPDVPATLGVGRASHTATVLPTGEVLVVGGVTRVGANNVTVEPTAVIYNPLAKCWRPTINMNVAAAGGPRYNHTATLLVGPASQAGKVLVCGGNSATTGTDNTLGNCTFFDPDESVVRTNCAGAGGSFTGTVSMQSRRAMHTATLLSDGRVFLAGGTDNKTPVAGEDNSYFVVTTEAFDPSTMISGPTAPLIERRAYHRATLLGDGRVLLTGGYNGREKEGNRGFLATTEIYDPVGNTMKPGARLNARKAKHGAVLLAGGVASIFGGIGNITTTYTDVTTTLMGGSTVYGCFSVGGAGCAAVQPPPPSLLSTASIRAGTAQLAIDFNLSVPVSGIIESGAIFISSPQINFETGKALLTPGFITNGDGNGGTFIRLDGMPVRCVDGVCGRVTAKVPIALTGQYFQNSLTITSQGGIRPAMTAGSRVNFPGVVDSDDGPTSAPLLYDSTFKGSITFEGLPKELIGATISSGILHVDNAGPFTVNNGDDLITVAITDGWATIPALGQPPPLITAAANETGAVTFTISISSVDGSVTASTITPQSAQNVAGFPLGNIGGTADMVTDFVNLAGARFETDIATVVVRRMIFQDNEVYDPTPGDAWTFNLLASGTGQERFDETVTLLPTNDLAIIGGRTCDRTLAFCPSYVSQGGLAVINRALGKWQIGPAMGSKRRAHTTTLLPSGKMLIAGGSEGPSVLGTAEIFDPASDAYEPAGNLIAPRDLHTATLLPNGRVLVAGGFSTNAVSSAPTRAAELFDPGTRTWYQLPNMPYAADNHTATLLADGNVLLAGGFSGTMHLSSAAVFVSTSNTWESSPAGNLVTARALHTATLLHDGRVFVHGGVNGTGVLNASEIYNPATRTWSNVVAGGDPAPRVRSHAATLLNDGRVLISGGDDGFGETNTSRVYDPLTNAWTDLALSPFFAPLGKARFNHTATLLPNGTVMAVGGSQALGGTVNSVEVFKVALSTWALWAELNTGRTLHTTTLGRDGFLYTFGGFDSSVADSILSTEREYFINSKDGESVGAGPSGPRFSSVTAVDLSPFKAGDTITITGSRLLGRGQAAGGGSGHGHSDHNSPHIRLQAVDGSSGGGSQGQGGFIIDLSTRFHQQTGTFFERADSSMSITLSNLSGVGERALPAGWYHLRVGQNALFSDSVLVQAGPRRPTGGVANLTANPLTITSNTISWSWTAAAPAFDGYNVYSSSSGVLIATRPASATTFVQAGLAANATGAIMVAPYTVTGDGPLAASATFFTLSTVPVNVAIRDVGFDQFRLTWDFNGNDQGTVYEITTSTNAFLTGISISTPVPSLMGVTTNNFLLTSLQYNTTYHVRLRAFNGSGVASDFSAVVSTRTGAPVQSLSGLPLSPTSIQWNWAHPGGSISEFKIYSATSGVVVATTRTTTFIDMQLSTNASRSIMVSAITDGREGPLSGSATVYTLAAVPVPQSPSLINVSTGSLTVLWGANGNPFGTVYDVSVVGASSATMAVETQQFSAGFTDIPPGTPVSVNISATNEDGVATENASLGTISTLARAPESLSVVNRTATSIEVAWSKSDNGPLVAYEVTYSSNGFLDSTTSLSFADGLDKSQADIGSLATSATYEIRVQARNPDGVLSAYSGSLTTSTYNGGAPPYQLRAGIPANTTVEVRGTIGENFRFVSLRVPAGAFSQDVTVTLSSITVPPSPCGALGTTAGVNIEVSPPMQPAKPVLLTVSYEPGEVAGISLGQATINRVDSSGLCVPLVSFLDSPNRQITAQLNHFSLFQVAAVAPANTVDTTHVFPNPYYAGHGDGYVTFSRMPARARIRIFTLRGEPVYSGTANDSGLFVWNAVNSSGRSIASGIYLVVVENAGSKNIKKLVVLR